MNAVLKMQQPFPEPPSTLKKSGKKFWKLGEERWMSGAITLADMPNWTLYCELWDEIDHCEEIVKRDGEYNLNAMGNFVEHPVIKRIQKCKNEIRRFSIMFGMAPNARKLAPGVGTTRTVAARKR